MCGDTHRALQDLRAAAGERGIGAPDSTTTGAALAGRTLCMLLCAQRELRIEDVAKAGETLDRVDGMIAAHSGQNGAVEDGLWQDLRRCDHPPKP